VRGSKRNYRSARFLEPSWKTDSIDSHGSRRSLTKQAVLRLCTAQACPPAWWCQRKTDLPPATPFPGDCPSAIAIFTADFTFTWLVVCVTLRWGVPVSCSRSKVRHAMILFMLARSLANADLIGSFSDTSAPRSWNGGVPLHQYAARLTGFSPFLSPSLWIDPTPRTIPVRFLVPVDKARQQRSSSVAEQTLNLVLDLFQSVFMGHPRPKTGARNRSH
jgi:hypothetical protein